MDVNTHEYFICFGNMTILLYSSLKHRLIKTLSVKKI